MQFKARVAKDKARYDEIANARPINKVLSHKRIIETLDPEKESAAFSIFYGTQEKYLNRVKKAFLELE